MATLKTIPSYSAIPYRKHLRPFLDEVKFGRTALLIQCVDKLVREDSFQTFIGQSPVFVPCPRSAPLFSPETVWPAHSIAKILHERINPSSIETVIARHTSVKKSAFCAPDERPTIQNHFDSINGSLVTTITPESNLILVDDFITKGATTIGCFDRLKALYPESTIKVFTLFRSANFSVTDVDCLYHPCSGEIDHFISGLSIVRHQE